MSRPDTFLGMLTKGGYFPKNRGKVSYGFTQRAYEIVGTSKTTMGYIDFLIAKNRVPFFRVFGQKSPLRSLHSIQFVTPGCHSVGCPAAIGPKAMWFADRLNQERSSNSRRLCGCAVPLRLEKRVCNLPEPGQVC
jgi:hypothetical protein